MSFNKNIFLRIFTLMNNQTFLFENRIFPITHILSLRYVLSLNWYPGLCGKLNQD